MKKSTATKIPTTPGTSFEGGFYVGRIRIENTDYALVVAPKAEGQHADGPWNESTKSVKGALSYCDGLANTKAMAKAGSKLAKWAQALRIGGFKDWYLPSQDEVELCYRYLKPGTDANALYVRSGINLSAVPPTYPYGTEPAKQTKTKAFRENGAQAFDKVWYWSSTQRAADSDYAWVQNFGNGGQNGYHKSGYYRARAVRRIKI